MSVTKLLSTVPTKAPSEPVGLVDVEEAFMELHNVVLELAAINGEITPAVTDAELDRIRRALIWRALEASRNVNALFG